MLKLADHPPPPTTASSFYTCSNFFLQFSYSQLITGVMDFLSSRDSFHKQIFIVTLLRIKRSGNTIKGSNSQTVVSPYNFTKNVLRNWEDRMEIRLLHARVFEKVEANPGFL